MVRALVPFLALLSACTAGDIAVPTADLGEAPVPGDAAYAAGRVMVAFPGASAPATIDVGGVHLTLLREFPSVGAGLYETDDVLGAVAAIRDSGKYFAAEPDYAVGATSTDPYRTSQWNLDAVGQPLAASYTDGAGVTVAVIDSGVSRGTDGISHVTTGWDFVGDDADASDENGHGTHVASTIAETADNGVGAAGLAPGVTILPIRVLDAAGSGYSSDVVLGIDYAVAHGAQVINLSLGSPSPSVILGSAVSSAVDQGVVVVAAAGNDGADTLSYPAAYVGVLSVGAVDQSLARASYSNGGAGLSLVAPGDHVLAETKPAGKDWGYYFYSGTSMASPHVAASAALLLAEGVDPSSVASLLEATATDLGDAGPDADYGAGLVQPGAAIAFFQSIDPPVKDPPKAPLPGDTDTPDPSTDTGTADTGTPDTGVPADTDVTPPTIDGPEFERIKTGKVLVSWTVDEIPASTAMISVDGRHRVEGKLHDGVYSVLLARPGQPFVLVATDEAGNTAQIGPFKADMRSLED